MHAAPRPCAKRADIFKKWPAVAKQPVTSCALYVSEDFILVLTEDLAETYPEHTA